MLHLQHRIGTYHTGKSDSRTAVARRPFKALVCSERSTESVYVCVCGRQGGPRHFYSATQCRECHLKGPPGEKGPLGLTDAPGPAGAGRPCTDCGGPITPGHGLCENCAAKRAGHKDAADAYRKAGVAEESEPQERDGWKRVDGKAWGWERAGVIIGSTAAGWWGAPGKGNGYFYPAGIQGTCFYFQSWSELENNVGEGLVRKCLTCKNRSDEGGFEGEICVACLQKQKEESCRSTSKFQTGERSECGIAPTPLPPPSSSLSGGGNQSGPVSPAHSPQSNVGKMMRLDEMPIGSKWRVVGAGRAQCLLMAREAGRLTYRRVCGQTDAWRYGWEGENRREVSADPVVEVGDAVESKFGPFTVTKIDERDRVRGRDAVGWLFTCQRDEIVRIIKKGQNNE